MAITDGMTQGRAGTHRNKGESSRDDGGRRYDADGSADALDFYGVLGVRKDASLEEIRRAYRKLVIKHHPDKGGDPENFQGITRAYDALCGNDKNQDYDPDESGHKDDSGESDLDD